MRFLLGLTVALGFGLSLFIQRLVLAAGSPLPTVAVPLLFFLLELLPGFPGQLRVLPRPIIKWVPGRMVELAQMVLFAAVHRAGVGRPALISVMTDQTTPGAAVRLVELRP